MFDLVGASVHNGARRDHVSAQRAGVDLPAESASPAASGVAELDARRDGVVEVRSTAGGAHGERVPRDRVAGLFAHGGEHVESVVDAGQVPLVRTGLVVDLRHVQVHHDQTGRAGRDRDVPPVLGPQGAVSFGEGRHRALFGDAVTVAAVTGPVAVVGTVQRRMLAACPQREDVPTALGRGHSSDDQIVCSSVRLHGWVQEVVQAFRAELCCREFCPHGKTQVGQRQVCAQSAGPPP